MNIISDAKLFVLTLKNDKYLHEDAILLGIRRKLCFYGIPQGINKYIDNPLAKSVLVILFPFFLLIIVLIRFIYSIFVNCLCKKEKLNGGEYFIATSNFSKSINNRINKYIRNACWLLNDGINSSDYLIPSKKYIYSLHVVNIRDLFSAFAGVFFSYFLILKQFGSYYMLRSLNAFQWLLFKKACDKIPFDSSIFFIDHKDRWAYLEDHIDCKLKTLIQHGSEISNCLENIAKIRELKPVPGGGWAQNNIPSKFKTLTKVIAFSDKEISAIKISLIDCSPEYKIGGYDFETYPLGSEKFSVLIIAFSGDFFEIESQIIKELQDFPIDIYVKNHPTQSNEQYVNLKSKFRFNLLTEQRFPHVNCVITYDSTLAHEYKSVGIEVLYHTILSIEKIKKTIKKQL